MLYFSLFELIIYPKASLSASRLHSFIIQVKKGEAVRQNCDVRQQVFARRVHDPPFPPAADATLPLPAPPGSSLEYRLASLFPRSSTSCRCYTLRAAAIPHRQNAHACAAVMQYRNIASPPRTHTARYNLIIHPVCSIRDTL